MFNSPFSFKGRISQLEYLLSLVFYCAIYFSGAYLTRGTEYGKLIFWSLFFVLGWFILAQGAKRCHDIGNNGWYQMIPFYFFWLVVEDGIPKSNKYGPNPKGLKGPEETGKIRKNEG